MFLNVSFLAAIYLSSLQDTSSLLCLLPLLTAGLVLGSLVCS